MFIPLFQHWGYDDVLLLAVMATTAWCVLAIWARLWVIGWVTYRSLTLWFCVLMVLTPLLLCIHSQIAEGLADGQRGLSLLKARVEREPNRNMVIFVDKLALSSANRQEFESNLLAAYAKYLYESNPSFYLPVTEWPRIKPDKWNLSDVYASRGTSEFEKTAMNAKNCDRLYQEVREYLATQQQFQNTEVLLAGYNWADWLVLTVALSLAIVPCRALNSINRRYCVPYLMR